MLPPRRPHCYQVQQSALQQHDFSQKKQSEEMEALLLNEML
jgi:hypothetical protein